MQIQFSNKPPYSVCPGPCFLKSIGLGGEIHLGSPPDAFEFTGAGRFDLADPRGIFLSFGAKNLYIGKIAKAVRRVPVLPILTPVCSHIDPVLTPC